MQLIGYKKQLKIGSLQPVEIVLLEQERRKNMNIAENIKRLRKQHNLSQEQLAEKLNVSRQSVSKWESGLAYPEMDKVLQICKMFNVNIDDLFNQDIKEVNKDKQGKNLINKYIDDFLNYVSKTIDMFSSFNFKQKIKCLFEQGVIIGILLLLFLILGSIFSSIIQNIFGILPMNIYHFIYYLFADIYIIVALIIGIVLVLHIFKIRYLDYYIIIKNEDNASIDNNETNLNNIEVKDNSKFIKKSEKIIIRDPKHSEYKFISGLLKFLLIIFKIVVCFIGLSFSISLICLISILAISFLFVKTGLTFIGILLMLVASIIVNILMLIIVYHFIINRKGKKTIMFIAFVSALIIFGIGLGITSIGLTSFDIINETEKNNYIIDTEEIEMTSNMFFHDNYNIEFVTADNDNLKIELYHSKLTNIDIEKTYDNDMLGIAFYDYVDEMKVINNLIDDINNKKIIDYGSYRVIVYTSKENIDKLNANKKDYYINYYGE